ncbi:MAG TPA: hypothetical protein VFN21_06565 [Acidimicrobiales bacterium]|nr:hypothetical protein [Acidimicrobiales bacterium]
MAQPVGPAARLVIASNAHYTEVANTAVAVLANSADVVQISGAVAALVTRLNGRPLAEVFAVEFDGDTEMSPRRLVEALRRLKVLGVIEDLPAGEDHRRCEWSDPVTAATAVAVAGRTIRGSTVPTVLHLAAPTPTTSATDRREPAADAATKNGQRTAVLTRVTPTGSPTTIQVDGHVLDELVLLTTPATSAPGFGTSVGTGQAPDPIEMFVALVQATDPRSQLAVAGVVDALAIAADSGLTARRGT